MLSQPTCKRVLVIDDEPDLVRTIGLRLRAAGYDVLGAMDSAMATHLAMTRQPDVIILDIGIPGESPGIVTSQKGWSKFTQTSVAMGHEVAVTPLQMVSAIAALANEGVLMKPYVVSEIQSSEGQLLKRVSPQVRRRDWRLRRVDQPDRLPGRPRHHLPLADAVLSFAPEG